MAWGDLKAQDEKTHRVRCPHCKKGFYVTVRALAKNISTKVKVKEPFKLSE